MRLLHGMSASFSFSLDDAGHNLREADRIALLLNEEHPAVDIRVRSFIDGSAVGVRYDLFSCLHAGNTESGAWHLDTVFYPADTHLQEEDLLRGVRLSIREYLDTSLSPPGG